MIVALDTLKKALAYARFEDPSIKAGVNDVVDQLQTELSGEQYEEGTAVEEATATLVSALDATDTRKEEAAAEPAGQEFDPFEGLGDEDEDDK